MFINNEKKIEDLELGATKSRNDIIEVPLEDGSSEILRCKGLSKQKGLSGARLF